MDIQKEREAFEQWYLQHYYTRNGLNPDGDIFKSYHDCDGWNYLYDSVFKAWVVWQAAKAQSDKKIKLLLCDEHLQKCESPTGVFNSQYPDEEPCLICLAKEAKAQAVPGWISVEDGLPPCDFEFCETGERVSNAVLIHSAATYGFNMGMGHVNEDGVWNVYSGEHDFMNVLMVTHWMPLPDAPQEQAND